MSETTSVTIVGGGMVGLTLAALLAQAEIPVSVVESALPRLSWEKTSLDARVSALNLASQRLLEQLGVWSAIQRECYSPLIALKVWDSVGGAEIDFESAEIGACALGAIVENREIIRVLWEQLEENEWVTFYTGIKPADVLKHEDFITLELENGQRVQSNLLVGADGAHSWVREQMQGDVHERAYHQSAMVAVVETERAHEQTGWQAFLPEGVLALLPLSNEHRCAIVWSTKSEHADELVSLSKDNFDAELNNAFGLRLGEIRCLNKPKAIPLVMRHVKKYVMPRMALIGDAAHTIHPLAGQGVNLGLMDAACLAKCLVEANEQHRDLGNLRPLRRYERSRKGNNEWMILAMRGFKELFGSSSSLVIQARNMGLSATNRSNLIKNKIMRAVIGLREETCCQLR